MTKDIVLGSHISVAGGLHKAFDRGESIGCTAMQIFTKSNRILFEKQLTQEQIEHFKERRTTSTIKDIVVHTGYLINIGSGKSQTAHQSTNALLEEVRRCQSLGLKKLVLHPGAHVGAGEDVCIKRIAHNLDHVLEQGDGTVTIVLEGMAGQGTTIGGTFEQLNAIRSLCTNKRHIGFCLDTCHLFAAGYDIATEDGYKDTIKKFDSTCGLEHVKAIHVNDSQTKFNSHVDRHAPIGKGHIPLTTFELLMNDQRLNKIPKILETPSEPDMKLWAEEIILLHGMVK